MRFLFLALGGCCLLLPLCASAQRQDPNAGPGQYPQFRNLSGLAGSGYGVDSQGRPSLSGPVAFTTPVAHVLGHWHFRFMVDRTSFDSFLSVRNRSSNNTAFGTLGFTVGRFNIAGTYFLKSFAGDQVYNAQVQYVPNPGTPWAASLGVQDIEGRGGSAGQGEPTDGRSSRSAFGVVTYRFDTRNSPVYLSLGVGTRRFSGPFGSVSYQVTKPLRVWMEQDKFGLNTGILLSWPQGRASHAPELNVLVGFQRARFFTVAAGIGF